MTEFKHGTTQLHTGFRGIDDVIGAIEHQGIKIDRGGSYCVAIEDEQVVHHPLERARNGTNYVLHNGAGLFNIDLKTRLVRILYDRAHEQSYRNAAVALLLPPSEGAD